MASATCLTASKISLLVGLGLRRSFFNLTFAFSSALLCSGSSPSLSCMDRRQSMQYCRFLSCFMGPPFSGEKLPVPQSSSREGMDRTEKLTQRVPHNKQPTHPNEQAHRQRGIQRIPRGSPSMQRRTDGLNYSHRRGPSEAPTALRPSSDDEGLGTRSDSKPEDLSKNLPNRQ